MDQTQISLLQELEKFGKENDSQATRQDERMLNITADTGAFLALLIKATQAQKVLEIGTSNGYSTIWMADAVYPTGGHVTTIEMNERKAIRARENFRLANVEQSITLIVDQADEYLPSCNPHSFDFIFLDSERSHYTEWWPLVNTILKPGGLIAVDNAVSHQAELVAFTELVQQTPGMDTVLVPIGKGELLIWKQR
ncbi:O-methyltransferase [Spirosoma migulaei]